jgi:MIP family channel proteins
MLSATSREAAAEFLGTFVLIVFGSAVVAQVVLSGGSHGGYLSINLAWGLAVTMGVYVSAGVSGAHLNPAVTLALAVHRQFPWAKVLPYWAAQLAGAFAASAVTFVAYREAFDRFDGGVRQVAGPHATAGIFATYPQEFLSNVPGGLVDQVVGTALLILVIFAIGDRRNSAPDAAIAPVIVGLLVVLIGMTFGFNAGYAINPARDLGPRLFTFAAGWGGEVFRAGHHWWWVPIVGPLVGGVLGGAVYDLLIARHHPKEERAKVA